MIDLFTTQGLNHRLEEMIKNSKKELIIISPFIRIQDFFKNLLKEKINNGVKITIVCRVKDLKDDLSDYASNIIDAPNLHAKCYMNENEAIISSLNLHDFSQINNIEMGIVVTNHDDTKELYGKIYDESTRIIRFNSKVSHENQDGQDLSIGKKYTLSQLDKMFNFTYKKPSGIKKSYSGDIFLFSNSTYHPYSDYKHGDLFIFQGQDTGGNEQQLIFGNKDLHECFGNKSKHIYLFKDFVFAGEHFITTKPYQEKGNWFFPLAKKQ